MECYARWDTFPKVKDNMIFWLNIHWADGTESTFDDPQSPVYKTKAAALKHGRQWSRNTGCPVFVIADGTVVAEFRAGEAV